MVATELRAITSIAATVAAVCNLLVVGLSRLFPSSLFGSKGSNFNLDLLIYWSCTEFVAAISNLIYDATASSVTYRPDGSIASVSNLCRFQSSIMQFSYLSSFLWMLCLTLNSYLQLFYLEVHPKKFALVYMLIAWLIPAINTLLISPLLLDYSAPTDLWCWIGSREHQSAQWLNFYIPLMAIFLIVVSLQVVIMKSLHARLLHGTFGNSNNTNQQRISSMSSSSSVPISSGGVSSRDLLRQLKANGSSAAADRFQISVQSLQTTWSSYLILFFIVRAPSFAHRGWEWFNHGSIDQQDAPEVYVLELLHALASPLQGCLPLILFFQSPRIKSVLLARWRRFRSGNTDASSGLASSGIGYRSLADHDANVATTNSTSTNLLQVFPAHVWNSLQEKPSGSPTAAAAPAVATATIPLPIQMPPTQFQAFPVGPSQQPLPLSEPASPSSNQRGSAPQPKSYRIMAGTFNMGNERPPLDLSHPDFELSNVLPTDASHDLNKWLPSGSNADQFDILAVGVQECEYDPLIGRGEWSRAVMGWRDRSNGIPSTERHWFETVCRVVNRGRDQVAEPAPENQFEDHRPFHVVSAISMGHIRLIILLHPRLVPLLSDIHSSTEGAGLGNIHVNKGGVGVSFKLGYHEFAFINCHLAALDGFQEDRNEDVVQILSRLQLQGNETSTRSRPGSTTVSSPTGMELADGPTHSRTRARSSYVDPNADCTCSLEQDPTLAFHTCIFLGDLNYRFRVPVSPDVQALGKKAVKREAFSIITKAIEGNDFGIMRRYDELCHLFQTKRLFVGWQEAQLQFYPTYKYKLNPLKIEPRAISNTAIRSYSGNPMLASARASNSLSPPVASLSSVESGVNPQLDIIPRNYASKRTPAWCDRILYKVCSYAHVDVLEYRDVMDVSSSDHKPVCATLQVTFDSDPNSFAATVDNPSPSNSEEEKKESTKRSPMSSPARRRKKHSDAAAAADGAEQFLAANPTAVEIISPASLKLLSSSTSSASYVSSPRKSLYTIEFRAISIYDVLDCYGLPLVHPYISFLGDILCTNCSGSQGGRCVRQNTAIVSAIHSSGDALTHCAKIALARNRESGTPFSLFQSSPVALQTPCIKCAEWDPIEGGDAINTDSPVSPYHHSSPSSSSSQASAGASATAASSPLNSQHRLSSGSGVDIPLLYTARRLSQAELQHGVVQLHLKDAHNLGENELVGVASVELRAGLTQASVLEQSPNHQSRDGFVFFMAPLLAQTRYMGFVTGYFQVKEVGH